MRPNRCCVKCNLYKAESEFYAGNGKDGLHYWCIGCVKLSNAASYLRNKNKVLERSKSRRQTHAKELHKYFKEYKKCNPDKVYVSEAKRRARKLNADVAWANRFYISEIYALAKLRTKQLGVQWHVDHIIPLSNRKVCGLHCEYNLQVIPAKQNLVKGNKYEI